MSAHLDALQGAADALDAASTRALDELRETRRLVGLDLLYLAEVRSALARVVIRERTRPRRPPRWRDQGARIAFQYPYALAAGSGRFAVLETGTRRAPKIHDSDAQEWDLPRAPRAEGGVTAFVDADQSPDADQVVPDGWTHVAGGVRLVSMGGLTPEEPDRPDVGERCGCHGPQWRPHAPPVSTEILPPGQLRIVAWDWARSYLVGLDIDVGALRERCAGARRRNGRRRELVEAMRDGAPCVRTMVAVSILIGIALARRPLPTTLAELIAVEERAIAALLVLSVKSAARMAKT